MKVLFKHSSGLLVTVTTTNVLHTIPIIECENKIVLGSLTYNLGAFLSSYVFANEIRGAIEQYKELCTPSQKPKTYSVQPNMDRYLRDFLIPDMQIMGYAYEVIEP